MCHKGKEDALILTTKLILCLTSMQPYNSDATKVAKKLCLVFALYHYYAMLTWPDIIFVTSYECYTPVFDNCYINQCQLLVQSGYVVISFTSN